MTATETPAAAPAAKTVPVQTRSERPASFKLDDFAPVSGREAEWKYTPVRDIKDLLEGPLGAELPRVDDPNVAGVAVSFIGRDDARLGSIHAPEDRAAANAWESFEQALLVSVSGEDQKQAVIRLGGYTGKAQAAHTFVEIAPHARGLVVIVQEGAGRVSESVEIRVGAGANVTLVTVGEWDDDAVNLSAHHARVGRDAFLKHVVVSLSGKLIRLNPSIALAESGADAELYGLYFADAGQHLEHQVWVHHIAEKTRSRVNYKGALQGKTAHSVWVGDVLIDSDAVGTDSYEENRNLLLSRGPKADSVPNLEIKCGNIEGAGHASATGRFEEDQLFYLMARGIDEQAARHLVVHGFLNEILQQIDNEEITAELNERLEQELEIADRSFAAGVNA